MSWPSIQEYEFAIHNFSRFVVAPQFKGGSPLWSKSGILIGFSGGYSVVYPVRVGTKTLALRCWIKDPGSAEQRYNATSNYIKTNPCKYFVDFGYEKEGILVNGVKRDVIYMDWIDGSTLSKYLDENIQNTTHIRDVAEKFKDMVIQLHNKKISHGDLQDGNILVCSTNGTIELKLVDYDSLFTPGLQSNPFINDELPGVIDYQHPNRKNQCNEKSDYFSELVIYLSLCAYAEQPSLWKQGQEKRLLFTVKDFEEFRIDPSKSTLYKKLIGLSPHIQVLTDKLVEFCCEKKINRLSPLEKILPQISSTQSTVEEYFTTPSATTIPASQLKKAKKGTPDELLSYFKPQPISTSTEKLGKSPAVSVSAPSQQQGSAPVIPISHTINWKYVALAILCLMIFLFLNAIIIFGPMKVKDITVHSSSDWQSTGIRINKYSLVIIDYLQGQWTVDASRIIMVGPEGYSTNNDAIIWNINQCKLLNSAPYGELLGRIGNGSIFPIGRSTLFFPADEGELFLSINDGYQCLGDNQGDIKIVIINR